MGRAALALALAASLLAQDPSAQPAPPAQAAPDGAVVRAVVKQSDAQRVVARIVKVARANDHAPFDRVSGDLLTLPPSAIRSEKPVELAVDSLVEMRIVTTDMGADVIWVKPPGAWEASEAAHVPERFATIRARVREEMRDPVHLFLADVLSFEGGDFAQKWSGYPRGSTYPIIPDEPGVADVRAALGVGTEVELQLGPKGIVKADILSGGVKATKWKGVWLGIGGVAALLGILWAWVVLRKRLIEA